MLAISKPYCDKVTATLEATEFHRLTTEFTDLVESMGGHADIREDGYRSLRLSENEQILVQIQHKLARVTINGRACATLNLLGKFGEALGVIGASPHRVTQIHAKVDVHGDNLPKVLGKYSALALKHGIHDVPPTSCRSLVEVRPDGVLAPNTYIGKAKAEMQRVVYDKRLERHIRGYRDFNDSTDELSVELRVQKGVTRAGLSLKDAYDVSPMFWHYMADCPIVGKYKPKTAIKWESGGSGFETHRTMRTKLDRVKDYDRFGDYITYLKLASECGYLPELLQSINSRGRKLLEGVIQHES